MITPTLLTLILSLHFFQTSASDSDCAPSCGIIRNIRSPFRLKGDPQHCGDSRFELACENNVTSFYLYSQKFYVKAINYSTPTPTIRLIDASINTNDTCSSSAKLYDFPCLNNILDATTVILMSCPNPLKNSSLFTDISHSCAASNSSSSHPRFTYIKVGFMTASVVKHMCRIDVVMTSWKGFKDVNNVSLQEFNSSLLYGFELMASPWWCGRKSWTVREKLIGFLKFDGLLLIPEAIAVFIVVGLSIPAVILGFIIALVLAVLFSTSIFLQSTDPGDPFALPSSILVYFEFNAKESVLPICTIRFIIFPLAMWFLINKFRRRHLSVFTAIESFLQSDTGQLMPIRYSYQDIKKMTGNFKDKIGEGGYGHVYKGKLRSGHYVAVKLLGKSGASGQDFINEIATIGRIHHLNIVKLVGYCAQGSKRALVYDFMANGSLEKYILNREKINSFNWDLKFEIAIGVARGIEYLHRGCDVQILHFDIKPHNVLLDDKFIPKLSDFGLAKFCSTDKSTVTMTIARGTVGYIAPELINRSIGDVSFKADVYSFGMMLMEILRLNKDLIGYSGDSNLCFPYWIYDHLNKGSVIEMEIACERNDIFEDDRVRILVRKMTIVALWCIQMSPNDRPSMNKVLEMLEGDIERLRIPECASLSTPSARNMHEGGSTSSSDSLPLISRDFPSSVEITIQE